MAQVDFHVPVVIDPRLVTGDDRSGSGSSLTIGSRFSGSTLRISDDGSASSTEDLALHPTRPVITSHEVSSRTATNEAVLGRRVADTGSYFITTSRSRYGLVEVHQQTELLGSYDPDAPVSSAATVKYFDPRKERKRRLQHNAAKRGNGNVTSARGNMDSPAPIETTTSISGLHESTLEPVVLRHREPIQSVLELESQSSFVDHPSENLNDQNSPTGPPEDDRGEQNHQILQEVESNVSPLSTLLREMYCGQLPKRQLAKVQSIKMPIIAEEGSRPSFPDIASPR
ncbi:hypothetical protein DL95DRAFT_464771 [Leptodontidium sp. 2 PMI_412]|nr:hypothetical protein DL95DRAFT_464771 [Leptodontidium sp. 2 PMI_412]